MSVRECLRQGICALRDYDGDQAHLTVQFIIEHVLGKKYVQLLAIDYCVTASQMAQIQSVVDRYLSHEPLAYILGTAVFRGHDYIIDPGVLIPRPETEELVGYAIKMIHALVQTGMAPVILECGVGSGVISIELARQFPSLIVKAWDISAMAIQVTQKNMQRHGINNIQLIHGDFFDTDHADGISEQPHVIVSNPPYISPSDYAELAPNVQKEPREALVADDRGLAIIHQLMNMAIETSSYLMIETGHDHHARIHDQFHEHAITFQTDMSGNDRFVFYVPPSNNVSLPII
ncbi:MAG: peptide chain release factor N(5)-glutamine methyltransferase [Candidatus Marinamargulisbacteria bacterium]